LHRPSQNRLSDCGPLTSFLVPQLLPFRALRYGVPDPVPDLSAVLCPPYDVISPAERARLAALDPRNAVHVELPEADTDETNAAGTPYDVAAATFARWLADGTLRRDDRPMIYVYEQRYTAADGSDAAARGFFCRLRLEPYGPKSGILPHEATMSGPKEDRFRLMSAVKANLSPVLLMYDDEARGASGAGLVDSIVSAMTPTAEGAGPGGLVNRLWAVDPAESDRARELLALASAGRLTIADGHHRYETALRYRDEVGGPGADFVLALLYEAHSGGLAILPWHRVLSGVNGADLVDTAASYFDVTPFASSADLVEALSAAGEPAPDGAPGVMGLWTRDGGAMLRVDRSLVESLLPPSSSETLRWMDVSVLSGTLSRMIGATSEELAAQGRLTYVSDIQGAVAEVESGRADATFLLHPTPIEQVLAVAAAGEHMPAKSTFFYPKAATGLVFNPLDV
jgi:uncharacterized protein (DUF1015 family)